MREGFADQAGREREEPLFCVWVETEGGVGTEGRCG